MPSLSSFLVSSLILGNYSLYGVTVTQTWVEHTLSSCGLAARNSHHSDWCTTCNEFSFSRVATQNWVDLGTIEIEIQYDLKDSSQFYCTCGATPSRLFERWWPSQCTGYSADESQLLCDLLVRPKLSLLCVVPIISGTWSWISAMSPIWTSPHGALARSADSCLILCLGQWT
jgi:hypothetical protein